MAISNDTFRRKNESITNGNADLNFSFVEDDLNFFYIASHVEIKIIELYGLTDSSYSHWLAFQHKHTFSQKVSCDAASTCTWTDYICFICCNS